MAEEAEKTAVRKAAPAKRRAPRPTRRPVRAEDGVAAPFVRDGLYGIRGAGGEVIVPERYVGMMLWQSPGEEFGSGDRILAALDDGWTRMDVYDHSGNPLMRGVRCVDVYADYAVGIAGDAGGAEIEVSVSPAFIEVDGKLVLCDRDFRAMDICKAEAARKPSAKRGKKQGTDKSAKVAVKRRDEFGNKADYDRYVKELVLASDLGHISLRVRTTAGSPHVNYSDIPTGATGTAVHSHDANYISCKFDGEYRPTNPLTKEAFDGCPPGNSGGWPNDIEFSEITKPPGTFLWAMSNGIEFVEYTVQPPEMWRSHARSGKEYCDRMLAHANAIWQANGRPAAAKLVPPPGAPGSEGGRLVSRTFSPISVAPTSLKPSAVAYGTYSTGAYETLLLLETSLTASNDVRAHVVETCAGDKDIVVVGTDTGSKRFEFAKSDEQRVLVGVDGEGFVLRGDDSLAFVDREGNSLPFPDYDASCSGVQACDRSIAPMADGFRLVGATEVWMVRWKTEDGQDVAYVMRGSQPTMRLEGADEVARFANMAISERWNREPSAGAPALLIANGGSFLDESGMPANVPEGATHAGCGLFVAGKTLVDAGGETVATLPASTRAVTVTLADGRFAVARDGVACDHLTAMLNRPYRAREAAREGR